MPWRPVQVEKLKNQTAMPTTPPPGGDGVATALFRALAAEAAARGCARMDWAVLDWNEPAKGFYRRLGARHNDTWEPWRLDGQALAALQE